MQSTDFKFFIVNYPLMQWCLITIKVMTFLSPTLKVDWGHPEIHTHALFMHLWILQRLIFSHRNQISITKII